MLGRYPWPGFLVLHRTTFLLSRCRQRDQTICQAGPAYNNTIKFGHDDRMLRAVRLEPAKLFTLRLGFGVERGSVSLDRLVVNVGYCIEVGKPPQA